MTNAGFVKAEGNNMTVNGKPIVLKGAGLGGWMNMENFITGYPGHEFQMRAAMKKVLGEDKYEYFFDKFLEYFFTDADAEFFASLGLNCLRLPVSYRHWEDDMNPGVFKQEGFKHLDRVIDLCAKHGIYTVIDMHAAPGGQNVDWHSDTGSNQALFWVHKNFQDRMIALWEHIAEHYRGNTWIAGYNVLNEPTDEEHTRLLAFYERAEKAIRAVDPDHMLFLDGNTFGADFSHFGEPLPNTVYACHDYTAYGFANPPETFTGTPEQIAYHEKQWARKTEYMRKHNMAIWNGEFGPTYAQACDGLPDWEEINEVRYNVLKTQLGIYAKEGSHGASWSIWTYKDIGFQGLAYVSDESAYMKLMAPFLAKKRKYVVDAWGNDRRLVGDTFTPIVEWLREASSGGIDAKYPPMWKTESHVGRVVRNCLLSECLVDEYASYFDGKSNEELDEIAKSFAFENCKQRTKLNDILKADGQLVEA